MLRSLYKMLLVAYLSLIVSSSGADDPSRWGLPDGAKLRIGRGGGGIAYLPDGSRLVVANSIGIWLYDTQTYQAVDLLFTGEAAGIGSITFSPDGEMLASVSGKTIRLWNFVTGEYKQTLTGNRWGIRSIAFSPDGRTLASGGGDRFRDEIHLWDVVTGEHKDMFRGHRNMVNSVAFSPDGQTLASGSSLVISHGSPQGDTIRLWDVVTGEHKGALTGHTREVMSVAFSPDGSTLASASLDSTVRLWDVVTGEHKKTLTEHTGAVTSVAFSPDGTTLASRSQTVKLWDAVTGQPKHTLNGGGNRVVFSPDGTTLASGTSLWDGVTGEHKHTLTGHHRIGMIVAFSPDGNTIASRSGGSWEEIHLWDVGTGRHNKVLTLPMYGLLNPDWRTRASVSGLEIRLWDGVTGETKHILTTGYTDQNAPGAAIVAFSPDRSTLVSVGYNDSGIDLWDVVTGEHKHALTGLRGYRFTDGYGEGGSVAFSPDGEIFASGGIDGIALWEVATGVLKRTIRKHRGVHRVAFSPDGSTLVSVSGRPYDFEGGDIRLWDVVTGEHKHTLTTEHKYGVSTVAFSPDGSTLASVGPDDNGIYLWDVVTGEHKQTLAASASSVVFSPDGRTLASGGGGTILLWEIVPSANANPMGVPQVALRIIPSPVQSPYRGEEITFTLHIEGGENVAGYQASVQFDTSALRAVEIAYGDYLPEGAFFVPAFAEQGRVTFAATAIGGVSNGDGTLATLTFEVIEVKASTLSLFDVILTDSAGQTTLPRVEHGQVTAAAQLFGDVNRDGIVNILDLTRVASSFGQTGQNEADVNGDGVVNIVDLVKVAGALGNEAAAPSVQLQALVMLTPADVQGWLLEARGLDLTNSTVQRGIHFLEQLALALTPKETALFPNYPNPFNPETWIPYSLATDAEVQIAIYDTKGTVVRRFDLGHQGTGYYTDRARAAYWDGRNAAGESVASGVYFYQLRAGDFTATRRMVILK